MTDRAGLGRTDGQGPRQTEAHRDGRKKTEADKKRRARMGTDRGGQRQTGTDRARRRRFDLKEVAMGVTPLGDIQGAVVGAGP